MTTDAQWVLKTGVMASNGIQQRTEWHSRLSAARVLLGGWDATVRSSSTEQTQQPLQCRSTSHDSVDPRVPAVQIHQPQQCRSTSPSSADPPGPQYQGYPTNMYPRVDTSA